MRSVMGLVVLMVALLGAGCGVPTTADPVPMPTELAALAPSPAASPESVLPGEVNVVSVPWVRGDRLDLVDRRTTAATPEEQATVALSELVGGPSRVELAAGLTTLVPADASITVSVDNGRATVVLDQGQLVSTRETLVLELGQVALAVLLIPGIDEVVLLGEDLPEAIPLPNGSRSSGPLRLADFRSLLLPGWVR